MEHTSPFMPVTDIRTYAVWILTLVIVAFGFRYAKEMISFVLDRLYDMFVEGHLFNK